MNTHQQKPPLSWGLISVFVIVSSVILILGILIIDNQRRNLHREKENELAAVANLKVGQISQWLHEKTGDANLIHDNLSLADQIFDFLNKSDNEIQKQKLIKWMNSIINNYDYLSSNIVDTKGRVRLSVPEEDSIIGPMLRPLIPKAFENRQIAFTDLHRVTPASSIHIDILIPMVRSTTDSISVNGLIILRINPSKILYPLVNSWPTPSKTSETLLIRRDGDSVTYLNELKYQQNSALAFKKEIKNDKLLAAKAVSGSEGIFEGVDYRNVPVIGVIKKVPDSPWYMISKVDKSELDNSFYQQQLLAKLLLIFFISAFGAVIGWMIWHQRVRFYRQKYEAEVDRLAVRKHFDYILKYANDIIFLIDEDLSIVEVNDRAIEAYKYSRDELIGMKIMKLRLPELNDQLYDQIKILNDTGQTRYETIHICSDGNTFPVEISARLVEIEGIKYYQSIGRDITERKRAENLLIEREFWLSESQRIGKIGSYVMDIKSNFWTSSEVLDDIFGIKKDSMKTAETWNMLVHPDDRKMMLDHFLNEVIAESRPFNKEYRIIKVDSGQECWVWGRGELSFDEQGNPVKMFGTIQDVTERKNSEILIVESEERFRKIFEESPFAMVMTKMNFSIIRVNPSFCKILGYDENEVINRTFRDFTHPEHINKDELSLFELIEGKIPIYKTEKRYICKDRSIIWGSTTVSAIKDKDGNVQYFLAMIEDITSRKESEIQIEESNSLLLATLESTADGILVVDTNGKIVQFNRRFLEMWNMPDTVLESRDDDKAISFVTNQLKDSDSFVNNVKHLYSNPESVSYDILEFLDGRIFERYSQPQKINDDIIGRVWSFRDITQKKIAEDLLINAKEKAEESDRLKTAFLHNISHEIRTPMNAIVGFTALLDDPDLKPESRKQFIDIIFQSSNQLLSIITDIVDISNIETGQTRMNITRVNINSIIRNLFEQYNLRATLQGLEFHYKVSLDDDEAVIETDSTKLIQILSNLLNNALKFTKKGKIEFGYVLKDSVIEFMASDTGIGISEDKQSKIFERFYQVENSISRQYGGTGLGLSICRAYAVLLGGNIRVESDLGKGSTFYVTLPFRSSRKNEPVNVSPIEKTVEITSGKTILVAEDDDVNFLVVQRSLDPEIFKLIRARNGIETVEICKTTNDISLVLLDLKMPVMDGLEAMKQIKKFRPDLPFVALTAYAFETDKRNAMEQGCSDYISKPFSKATLVGVIAKYM